MRSLPIVSIRRIDCRKINFAAMTATNHIFSHIDSVTFKFHIKGESRLWPCDQIEKCDTKPNLNYSICLPDYNNSSYAFFEFFIYTTELLPLYSNLCLWTRWWQLDRISFLGSNMMIMMLASVTWASVATQFAFQTCACCFIGAQECLCDLF